MRSRIALAVVAVAVAGAPVAARTKIPLRCCVDLKIPALPPGPVCAELATRRARLACRLIGGRAMGRGACSPDDCSTGRG